jgi:hypothetical protein
VSRSRPRSSQHGRYNIRLSLQAMISITGPMDIRSIKITQAQHARPRKTGTRMQLPRTTTREESSGANNDAESQLRFKVIS